MLILPIRTESIARQPPRANYAIIALNLVLFILFLPPVMSGRLEWIKDQYLGFQSDEPTLYQFITYQFIHADVGHLVANLLFLWVFGNSVNGKMGDIPYALFYLAGGIFAAWGYASVQPASFQLIGASGAIAAVTTAYLALFPRSRVTTLVWFFFFLHFLEIPAIVLIGLKVIVWDNIVGPAIGEPSQVAYGAHLAGYLFGFVGALIMLWLRAVPRDQFDLLALWRRWLQRREMRAAMAGRPLYGAVGQELPPDLWDVEHRRLDQIDALRTRISNALLSTNVPEACEAYRQLLAVDPRQCLSESQQLVVARALYAQGRFAEAVAALERFVECYSHSLETPNVRLLLGITYARDLHKFEPADTHLTACLQSLRDAARRAQCLEWLRNVRAALGRPIPEM